MSVIKIPGSCRQILVTLIVNILSVHMGVAFGWTLVLNPMEMILQVSGEGPLVPGLEIHGNVPDGDILLSRLSFICILAVLPLTALINERFGRRLALAASTIPFIMFCLTIAAAKNSTWIFTAMIFGSIACAMQLYLVPMYVFEISSSNRRGVYSVIRTLLVGIGVYLGFFKAQIWLTPIYAMCSLILVMVFLIGLKMVPESPVWLARKERLCECRSAQDWLRKDEKSCASSEAEKLNEGLGNINEIESGPVAFTDIFRTSEVRKGFGVAACLLIGQAILQINWLLTWYVITERMYLWLMDPELPIPINITFYMAICIMTLVLIDTVGRRPMLIISCTIMATVLIVFGVCFILATRQNSQWILSALLSADTIFISLACLLIACYVIGMGAVPSIIAIEIIPSNVVSYVHGFSMAIFWIATWFVTETWQYVIWYFSFVYWLFGHAAICLLLVIFVSLFVPETKAKSVVFRGKIWRF